MNIKWTDLELKDAKNNCESLGHCEDRIYRMIRLAPGLWRGTVSIPSIPKTEVLYEGKGGHAAYAAAVAHNNASQYGPGRRAL